MSTCNGCGKTNHAGGCDLVDFYYYQRWARVNPGPSAHELQQAQVDVHVQEKVVDPCPPGPLTRVEAPPVKEPPALAQQTSNSSLRVITEVTETSFTMRPILTPLKPSAEVPGRAGNPPAIPAVFTPLSPMRPIDDPRVVKAREVTRKKRIAKTLNKRKERARQA